MTSCLEYVTECLNCVENEEYAKLHDWTNGNWTDGVCDWCKGTHEVRTPLDPKDKIKMHNDFVYSVRDVLDALEDSQ